MKQILLGLALLLIMASCSEKIINTGHKSAASSYAGDQELKVLCYNIHHANPPSKEKEGLIDIDAIANVIKTENPDVVALQEIDKQTKRSGNIDEAKQLAERTGMNYHFFKAINHDGGEYGTMILSKLPFSDAKSVPLPKAAPGEDRIITYVTVKLPSGKKFILANTHLDAQRSNDTRTLQMKAILKEFATTKSPVVLCGDLNSLATSDAIHLLDEQFTRTCTQDCPGTIPQLHPVRTIDYIAFKNADWLVRSYRVIPETYASDHRPVAVTFKIN
jgi:endonuclease/exonuclease/phosphatase family metal-dependent hydrolase